MATERATAVGTCTSTRLGHTPTAAVLSLPARRDLLERSLAAWPEALPGRVEGGEGLLDREHLAEPAGLI